MYKIPYYRSGFWAFSKVPGPISLYQIYKIKNPYKYVIVFFFLNANLGIFNSLFCNNSNYNSNPELSYTWESFCASDNKITKAKAKKNEIEKKKTEAKEEKKAIIETVRDKKKVIATMAKKKNKVIAKVAKEKNRVKAKAAKKKKRVNAKVAKKKKIVKVEVLA